MAAAADVSQMTVFNYFPTNEDLVLHRFEDHFDDVVAVRRDFLAGLRRHDPSTGLYDGDGFLAFQEMVMSAPSLRFRVLELAYRSVEGLAAELAEQSDARPDDIAPNVVAGMVCSTRTELVRQNVRRLTAGEKIQDIEADALASATQAFDLLEHGIGDYCR